MKAKTYYYCIFAELPSFFLYVKRQNKGIQKFE